MEDKLSRRETKALIEFVDLFSQLELEGALGVLSLLGVKFKPASTYETMMSTAIDNFHKLSTEDKYKFLQIMRDAIECDGGEDK